MKFSYHFIKKSNIDVIEWRIIIIITENTGKLTIASLKALCKQYEVELKDEEVTDMVSASLNYEKTTPNFDIIFRWQDV